MTDTDTDPTLCRCGLPEWALVHHATANGHGYAPEVVVSRRQKCLVCYEAADTEAPLCKACVAKGASADDRSITITFDFNAPSTV